MQQNRQEEVESPGTASMSETVEPARIKHSPAFVIRSGKPILLRERRRGMAMVFLPPGGGKRALRKVARPKRVPGRVNHGTAPLKHWWWAGFRRDPKIWAQTRVWRGVSGRVGRLPPPHQLRHEAMRAGWMNHQDNVFEQAVCSYVPRPAEFHLIGMRRWLMCRTEGAKQHWIWPGPWRRRKRKAPL